MTKCCKKNEENYIEYRDRVLNKISPSFCGAKWFNSTIWLGNGMTASCHHPPAHKIPFEEVSSNYKSIHNTSFKKETRQQMLDGIRPKECEYCWKIEDIDNEKVSDRVHKSVIYEEYDLYEAKYKYGSKEDVNLKTLEIAFDSICNLACSYCNPSFSTAWQVDIQKNGFYKNIYSDGAGAFKTDGLGSMPYGKNNIGNPYVDAFWLWWESDLKSSLQELRITGGEPLMSPNFWKLMEWWQKEKDCNVELAVNSNLSYGPSLLESLIKATKNIKNFHLYTSCESFGSQAEYIRDGFSWTTWLSNLERFLEDGNYTSVNCMLTINGLSLFSLTDFLDEMIKLKEKHKKTFPVCSFNILRFPSFMSVLTLPKNIRTDRARHLEKWLTFKEQDRSDYFTDWEADGVKRLISYLDSVEKGHMTSSDFEIRQRDWKSFYGQYDKRRGKSFVEAFPELKEWWESIS